MRTVVNIKACDLENGDTVEGYKIKDIIIFAKAVEAAGITNDELASFAKNVDNAFTFVREQQDRALSEIFKDIKNSYGF